MRKLFLFLLMLSLVVMPTMVQAQSNVMIKELNIQLWPEYDRSEMLVMYSFTLSGDTPLPTNMQIRVPANAEVNAVAKVSEDTMVTVPYDTPVRDGDWQVITLVIDELTSYRVEYYEAIKKENTTRNFSFLWESDYEAELLFIEFQQPPSATNLATTPKLPNANPVAEGMIYHTLTKTDLPAGEPFALEISYDKNNDDLTVSSMPVEVGGEPENEASSFSVNDSLPAILVGAGVLLIVGGFLYFFLAGRSSEKSNETRKRHSPRTASAGGNIYCHECGGRARPGDKFCRACGVKLRL